MITTDMKLLTTEQVRQLAAQAAKHEFEQQLSDSQLEKLADDKYHIAIPVPRDDNSTQIRRARIMLGFKGVRGAKETYLDVADNVWDLLPDADFVRQQLREQDNT